MTLTPGSKGEFTVVAEDIVLFDKARAGRFPEEVEVLDKLPLT